MAWRTLKWEWYYYKQLLQRIAKCLSPIEKIIFTQQESHEKKVRNLTCNWTKIRHERLKSQYFNHKKIQFAGILSRCQIKLNALDSVWGFVYIYIYNGNKFGNYITNFLFKLISVLKSHSCFFFFLMPFMTGWKHEFEIGIWNSIKSHPLMSCWEHMDIIFTYRDYFPWANFLEITKDSKHD